MHFRWQSTKVRLREKLYLTSSSRKIVIRIYYNFKKLLLISMMALEKQWKCKCFSHVQLFCDPMDCSLPGSTVKGILQARILEWVAIPFSRGSSRCRNWTQGSCTAGTFFTIWATREAWRNNYTNQITYFYHFWCFEINEIILGVKVYAYLTENSKICFFN